ncbi:MAG: hypothetical protein ACI351_00735 [Candidatus Avelusimicrobium sp.]|uniref:hypothetical protein n=1 Tax=Candidatus Avelusimicrobium sp. TaxID=3048833 RepID=UPI003F11FC79
MKTLLGRLALFTVIAGLCGCTPSEEDIHPKKNSSRSYNLRRYIPKGQELRALEQSRSKPIVSEPLLPSEALREFLPKSPDTRISQAVVSHRAALKESVRASFARRAADKMSALAEQLKEEVSSAAALAQTPEEMQTRVAEVTSRYVQSFSAVGEEETAKGWTRANAQQGRLSVAELKNAFQELAVLLERDYGPLCARKAFPILQKAADDYGLVLSSVKTEEDFEPQFARVGHEADQAFAQVAARYGDPALTFSPEEVSVLTARMISAHQRAERMFEKLYGKEAVFQTRDIFENYLNEANKLFAKAGRLSDCLEKLDALNSAYREEMTSLQVKLNEELEQKLLSAHQMRSLQ